MIKANVYEETYECVKNSKSATQNLDEVIQFLRTACRPVTCKEIGLAVFGARYERTSPWKPMLVSHMGQMLKHLRKGGFIKVVYTEGEPVEVLRSVYVEPENAEPRHIQVYDKEGNEYTIANPKYDWWLYEGHYEDRLETITPKIKMYEWIGE